MNKVFKSNFLIYFDQYLFIAIALLSIMGLVFLYSASQENLETTLKQSLFVIFGLILMFVLSQPDPDFYKIFFNIFININFISYFALLIGREINGAKRWLDLGLFTLQSSEVIKVSLPVFLAAYLYDKTLPINLFHTFISLI